MLQKSSEYLVFQNSYSMIKLSCYKIRIYEFVEYVLCMWEIYLIGGLILNGEFILRCWLMHLVSHYQKMNQFWTCCNYYHSYIIYEVNRQSRFDAWYWILGAGALFKFFLIIFVGWEKWPGIRFFSFKMLLLWNKIKNIQNILKW